VLCIKRDLEGNIALNKIVSEVHKHELFVILSDQVLKIEREVKESAEFVFYERDLLVEYIFPLLEKADTLPDTGSNYLTFNQIAQTYGLSVEIIKNINGYKGESRLKEIQPDIILSCRYDLIFKKNIINIPRLGILNIHPGKLPEYRGVDAPFRAMLNRESQMGCSLHVVDQGLDTGPVIGIKYLTIDYSKSVLWHIVRMYPLGIDMFLKILPGLENGEGFSAVPQDSSKHKYYTYPEPAEFEEFTAKGYKLIDNGEYLDLLSNYLS